MNNYLDDDQLEKLFKQHLPQQALPDELADRLTKQVLAEVSASFKRPISNGRITSATSRLTEVVPSATIVQPAVVVQPKPPTLPARTTTKRAWLFPTGVGSWISLAATVAAVLLIVIVSFNSNIQQAIKTLAQGGVLPSAPTTQQIEPSTAVAMSPTAFEPTPSETPTATALATLADSANTQWSTQTPTPEATNTSTETATQAVTETVAPTTTATNVRPAAPITNSPLSVVNGQGSPSTATSVNKDPVNKDLVPKDDKTEPATPTATSNAKGLQTTPTQTPKNELPLGTATPVKPSPTATSLRTETNSVSSPTESPTRQVTATRNPEATNTPTKAPSSNSPAVSTDTLTPTNVPFGWTTPTPRPTPTHTNTTESTDTNTPRPPATNTNTVAPTDTETLKPTDTNTPRPPATNTNTVAPTDTETSKPTDTNTPRPTWTNTYTPIPEPTGTNTPRPTWTNTYTPIPEPTGTNTPRPTWTNTYTPIPEPTGTNTPRPTWTNTYTPIPEPTGTNTPRPTWTNTYTPSPEPTDTNTPRPTWTNTYTPLPEPTDTNTPIPLPTNTNTSVPTSTDTSTPVPTSTETATPIPTDTPTEVPTDTPTSTPLPTNASPVPADDSVQTHMNEAIDIPVLNNDWDPDGSNEDLRLIDINNGTSLGGKFSIKEGNRSIRYEPPVNVTGITESAFYFAADKRAGIGQAKVLVEIINWPPELKSPTDVQVDHTIFEDQPLLIFDSDVREKFIDKDRQPLQISWDDPPHGSLRVYDSSTFEYTPDAGFTGQDTVNFYASDGKDTSPAWLLIVNVKANTAPLAATIVVEQPAPYNQTIEINTIPYISDADGDSMTISVSGSPQYGQVEVRDHVFRYTLNNPTPAEEYDSFSYTVSDGKDTASAIVKVKVRVAEATVVAITETPLETPTETPTEVPTEAATETPTETATLVVDVAETVEPNTPEPTLISEPTNTETPSTPPDADTTPP